MPMILGQHLTPKASTLLLFLQVKRGIHEETFTRGFQSGLKANKYFHPYFTLFDIFPFQLLLHLIVVVCVSCVRSKRISVCVKSEKDWSFPSFSWERKQSKCNSKKFPDYTNESRQQSRLIWNHTRLRFVSVDPLFSSCFKRCGQRFGQQRMGWLRWSGRWEGRRQESCKKIIQETGHQAVKQQQQRWDERSQQAIQQPKTIHRKLSLSLSCSLSLSFSLLFLSPSLSLHSSSLGSLSCIVSGSSWRYTKRRRSSFWIEKVGKDKEQEVLAEVKERLQVEK